MRSALRVAVCVSGGFLLVFLATVILTPREPIRVPRDCIERVHWVPTEYAGMVRLDTVRSCG